MDKDFIIVMVTCSSIVEARKIADSLLKKRLVACANIISNIESKFWWKGKIDSAREVLIMMKTKKENFKKLENKIKKLHSYEVPEIIAVAIVSGSREYLSWINEVTRTK